MNTYDSYAAVPWFRKRWFVVLTLLVFSPVSLIVMWTGPVYYKSGEVIKTFSRAVKVILSILGIISVLQFASYFMSGENHVDAVKNGTLGIDESITVGAAFDTYKYFGSTSWESFTTEKGRRIVQVTAPIDLAAMRADNLGTAPDEWKSADVTYQFTVNPNDGSFELTSFGVEITNNEGEVASVDAADLGFTNMDMVNQLQAIYNDESIL